MLAYYVHNLSPFLIQFHENIGVRWYGVAYLLAFLIGFLLVRHLSRRGLCEIPPDDVGDFITGCAIFGVVIGGRVGYMLFYGLDGFLHNPLSIFFLWDGGMSAHGGIVGVTLYTLWYSRRHKISWRNVGDNLVVPVPLGLLLGRLANFINGELYGRVTSVPWAMQFPKELYDPKVPQELKDQAFNAAMAVNPSWSTVDAIVANVRHSEELRRALAGILSPRHPSQLYEATLEGAFLFGVLWTLRTRFRLPNGVITGVFFIGYAIVRSTVEFFREPDAPLTGSLTRGQFLSLFLVLIGLGFLLAAWLRPSYPGKTA